LKIKFSQKLPKVIAELSGNHNSRISNAYKLIDKAVEIGVDLVKIQTYTPDTLTLNSRRKEFLIKKGIWKGYYLYDLYKKAHTPYEWHKDLFEYSKKKGMNIFSSPFDQTAVELLEKLNCPLYKIASPEIIDLNLLKIVALTDKDLIISTGMASNKEIYECINTVNKYGKGNIILLHCISGYPSPIEEMNLNRINFLKKEFGLQVGLSDHSSGVIAPIVATTLGIVLIEKHLTLNKRNGGIDSEFSLDPIDFGHLVKSIKQTTLSMGKYNFKITKSELITKKNRRSIYASRDIQKDEYFTDKNIRSVRPGNGLHPRYLETLKKLKSKRKIKFGEPIKKLDLLK